MPRWVENRLDSSISVEFVLQQQLFPTTGETAAATAGGT